MIRPGTIADLAQITVVRTSVRENHLSVEQMAAYGITPQSIAADMTAGRLGCWVSDLDGTVVGFSMAERETGNIFALFVLPEHEGRGHGSALLAACENWLRELRHAEAILNTGPGTRAYQFYLRKGYVDTDVVARLFAEDHILRKQLGAGPRQADLHSAT